MKNKIALLFIFLLVVGCSSDDSDPFYGYKIEDTTGIDINSIQKTEIIDLYSEDNTSTKTALYGIKNGKIWISIFNNSTKEKIYEYTYNEKIPSTINLPFGEVFNVVSFYIGAYEYEKLITISGEYLNYIPEENMTRPTDSKSRISFDGVLISERGYTTIEKVCTYPWYEKSIICSIDNSYVIFNQNGEQVVTIKNLPQADFVPLSFVSGILINSKNYYSLENYNNEVKDTKEIKEVSNLMEEGQTDQDHITYEIKGSDSSFANIIYHITLITGEVVNYTLKINLSDGSYQWTKNK